MKGSGPLLDPTRHELLAGHGVDLFGELAELYLRESDRRLAEVGRAIAAAEPAALVRAAHALLGASLNFGAPRLAALAADLESEARAGRVSSTLHEEAVTALEATRRELAPRLHRAPT